MLILIFLNRILPILTDLELLILKLLEHLHIICLKETGLKLECDMGTSYQLIISCDSYFVHVILSVSISHV